MIRLGDLQGHRVGVFLWCQDCHHNAVLLLEPLMAHLGADQPVPTIKGRCSRCHSRNVEVRPDWSAAQPGVVTNHQGAC